MSTTIQHRDDCRPDHMSEPDAEGIRDCSNCGLFEYPKRDPLEQACRDCAALFPYDPDADRCPACVAAS